MYHLYLLSWNYTLHSLNLRRLHQRGWTSRCRWRLIQMQIKLLVGFWKCKPWKFRSYMKNEGLCYFFAFSDNQIFSCFRYAYAIASATHGIRHILRKDFMIQVSWFIMIEQRIIWLIFKTENNFLICVQFFFTYLYIWAIYMLKTEFTNPCMCSIYTLKHRINILWQFTFINNNVRTRCTS